MTRSFFKELEFKGVAPEEKHSDGRTIYRAVATTPALDRYGEVVLPKGAMVDNFMKNPVLLENHNYAASSVGHVVNLEIGDEQVTFDFVFSSDTRGAELEQKFAAGDMNAFSIGFKPKAVVNLWQPWDEMPEVKELTVQYPDGTEGLVDLSGYEHVPYRVYNKWELLEISPVAVPANPEALLMRTAEEIVRRVAESNPVMKSFVQDELATKLGPVMEMLEAFTLEFGDSEIKFEGAVASHSTPIVEGEWSGSSARVALAKWASKGGSGKKEDMNWSKYSKGFAWFDSKAADSLGAYKLPHHTIKDGSLVAVWRGVTAAMAALLGARGGVDLDSKSAVYAHLAKHYKDFDKEAPEMKDYSEDELKAIEEEPLVRSADPSPGTEVRVEDQPANGEPEPEMPSNMQAMMGKIVEMLAGIQAAINKLAEEQASESEMQQENFVELHIKADAITDIVERGYVAQKKEVKVESNVDGNEGPTTDVSRGLIEKLERVVALE